MNTNVVPYEQTSTTVDVLLFAVRGGKLQAFLVRRANEPFKGKWALPGVFVQRGESLDEAVERTLAEKVGVKPVYFEQLYTFGEPKRDPRARVVTVAYLALVSEEQLQKAKQSTVDISRVEETIWRTVGRLPKLAFDHNHILKYGLDRLKAKAGYSNIVFGLLPKEFRLSQLRETYEIILNKKLDKRNFRKKMLALNLLEPTGKKELQGTHRPAMLYRFKKEEIVFFD